MNSLVKMSSVKKIMHFFVILKTYPDMLVHVAGGCKQSVADVAFVWSVTFPNIRSGSSSVHHDSMDRLEMNIQVPGL